MYTDDRLTRYARMFYFVLLILVAGAIGLSAYAFYTYFLAPLVL